MAIEDDNKGKGEGGEGGTGDGKGGAGGGEGKGGASGAAGAGKEGAGKEGAAGAGKEGAGKEGAAGAGKEGVGKAARRLGDDEELEDLLDGKEEVTLSRSALIRRLGRMNNRELDRLFGHHDVEKIVDEKKELDALRKEKQEAADKDKTAQQKLEQDLAELKKNNDKLTADLSASEDRRLLDKQEGVLRDIASNYVAPKHAKRATREYLEYVEDLTDREAAKIKPVDTQKWFEDFAKENPEFVVAGKEGGDGKGKEGDGKGGKLAKEGANTGGKGAQPNSGGAGGGAGGGKKSTINMSKAEFAQYAKEKGIRPNW